MRPERAAAHLLDVVRSVDLIDGYLAGGGPDAYEGDQQLRDAVEPRFGILAEALARLEAHAPALHARISHTPQIRGFRNVVIHQYDQVDPDVLLNVVTQHLPVLRREAAALLVEIEPAADDPQGGVDR